ncbi:MAG TPA: hypothetical protein VG897_17845, partial [Terriglobales bacterium]|nr:hypothetical protein [Terriglobales bacterium]
QLKSDLEVLVESTQAKLNIQDGVPVSVLADPSKLLSALGGLAAAELESYQPGGVLNINTKLHRELLEIELQGKGVRKPAQNSAEEKLTDIRRSAAYCYIWTLGGDIEIVPNAVKLTLPIAKS